VGFGLMKIMPNPPQTRPSSPRVAMLDGNWMMTPRWIVWPFLIFLEYLLSLSFQQLKNILSNFSKLLTYTYLNILNILDIGFTS
jgi:hypothetical protein